MNVIYRFSQAKSEALFNIYRFLKENIESSNTKDKLKATRTVKTTTIDLISKKKKICTCSTLFFFLISKKTTLHVQQFFLYISLPLFYTTNVKLLLASYLRVLWRKCLCSCSLCFFTAAPFSH